MGIRSKRIRDFPFSRERIYGRSVAHQRIALDVRLDSVNFISAVAAVVRVVARPAQMAAWAGLFGKLERRHRQSESGMLPRLPLP